MSCLLCHAGYWLNLLACSIFYETLPSLRYKNMKIITNFAAYVTGFHKIWVRGRETL